MRDEDPVLLSYQLAWVKDESPMKICEKSRRIGLTWASAYRRVKRAIQQERLDAWWLTRDLVTAREFIRYCKDWCNVIQGFCERFEGMEPWRPLGSKGARAMCLYFSNGSRIHVLSSNPDAAAGKGGDVGIDEFALHRHQDLLYQVARPVTMWGNQLEIISTHRGVGTTFHTLVTQARGMAKSASRAQPGRVAGNAHGWNHHRITLPQAVDAGLVDRINARNARRGGPVLTPAQFLERERRGCIDEAMWLQEYCCEPADEATALLPYSLIGDCEAPWETLREATTLGAQLHGQSRRFAGMDVGRHHHFSVIWIVEELGDVLYTREVKVLQGMEMSRQEDILLGLLHEHGVSCLCIDSTGIGISLAENATRRYREHGAVEGVHFSTTSKDVMALALLRRFQDRAVRIPGDPAIRQDLHAIRRKLTVAGHVRYDADAGPNGHADRFWALALAIHATRNTSSPPVIDGERMPLAPETRMLS